MKKKAKKRLPGSKVKKQRKFTRKKQRQQIQYGIGQKMINSVVIALDEDDKIHVRKIVEGLDEYDLARLIEALDFNHRRRLVEILGDHIDPEVFPELNEIVQEQVIETLDEGQIVNIVNELDSDDAVEILEHMDDKEQKSIIEQLDPELKYQVESSLNYPEDSAGRIMSRDFVSMPDDWTVKEAKQYLLSDTELPDEFYTVFLTDSSTLRPTGEITLDKLLRAKGDEKLCNIMDCEIVPMSALVVDNKGRLIGVINIDDVVDIVHEEASEDIMHLSGAEEGDVYKSVFGIFRSRSVWLITNLFATILASTVVKEFQDIIAEISVLAVLMPIVASMGGTTGNQTLAVVVRALATKELTSRNTLRMIGKEFMVGVVNGFLFACLIGLITWFMFPARHELSAIIAIAMLCNLSLASLAGILIPLTLNRFKVDPAISSGVFLIAMTDSGGYFIFLGLARLILF